MVKKFPKFRVAAIQAGPIIRDAPKQFDLKSTVDKATRLILEAGKERAKLIVFPECWLPCFPYWSLTLPDDAGFEELWANFLWHSVEVPSAETEILGKAAQKANAYVVMGINERDKRFAGRMYNSILYLGPNGKVIGKHQKICNTVQERFFHTPGNGGENLKSVFQTELGKLGGSICGEHAQLLLMYNWIMQGLQIHCSLWPGIVGLEKNMDLLTRAFCRIGHVYGVLSATCIPEHNMPKNFYPNSYFNIPKSIRGGSGVINPSGEYIAGPVYDKETIVYGDIDLSEIDQTRYAVNLSGIYSRWDLFRLDVQEETYTPLSSMSAIETKLSSSVDDRLHQLDKRIHQLEQKIMRALETKTSE